MNDRGNIVIYQTKDGKTSIDVKLEDETVWLTQAQMAELFQKDRTVIGRHINNVYREGELERDITCAKFAHMGSYSDQQYETAVYNLDVIISVGYRVKSQRGTQFRVWANKVLKEYLIKGYAINQQVKIEQLEDLKNTVHLLSNVIEHKQLTLDEANGLLRVITDYTYGLDTLDKYDFQQLEVVSTTPSREFRATYEEAMGAIHLLQEKFGSSDLFGNEKTNRSKVLSILIAFLVLVQHLSPLLKPYFSVFPLFYGVFYFRLTIISRHRNINRTLTSIDILQLLFFFQPFDMSGGSGKRKFAKSLKVRAGQYLVITEIRGQQSVYLFVGAWH